MHLHESTDRDDLKFSFKCQIFCRPRTANGLRFPSASIVSFTAACFEHSTHMHAQYRIELISQTLSEYQIFKQPRQTSHQQQTNRIVRGVMGI